MIRSPDLAVDYKKSFLSSDKDKKTILYRLFMESKPYSNYIKRLLVINNKDCLSDKNQEYERIANGYSLKRLMDEGYVRIVPKLELGEHEDLKSYVMITDDDYSASSNPNYRTSTITIWVLSALEAWELDNFELRPWKIAGYIDGIMSGMKLSGIGRLEFVGAQNYFLSNDLGGVVMYYTAYHGTEDKNPEWGDPKDLKDVM